MPIRLGYACLCMELQERGIFSSRTARLSTLKERGAEYAKELALQNIEDTQEIVKYNEQIGIRFFRLTSNLFPHIDNPEAPAYNTKFAKRALAKLGCTIRELGHRVTMHPAQFAQLGAVNPQVLKRTVQDLTTHATIFRAMDLHPNRDAAVMILHGGGEYGSKSKTLERWETTWKNLPQDVRQYIVIENDDYIYTIQDLLPMCEKLGLPLCVDFFHHECNPGTLQNVLDEKLWERILNVWHLRGIKPKVHISSQRDKMRKGTHSDFIQASENILRILQFCDSHDIDVMVEAKQKERAVLDLYKKYFIATPPNSRSGPQWRLKHIL